MKVFNHYNLPGEPTDDLRSAFKSKLWRMGQALSKVGGTKRKKVIEQWKETSWVISVGSLSTQRQLLKSKRQLEAKLENEKTKRQKLEDGCTSLEKEIVTLRQLQRSKLKQLYL